MIHRPADPPGIIRIVYRDRAPMDRYGGNARGLQKLQSAGGRNIVRERYGHCFLTDLRQDGAQRDILTSRIVVGGHEDRDLIGIGSIGRARATGNGEGIAGLPGVEVEQSVRLAQIIISAKTIRKHAVQGECPRRGTEGEGVDRIIEAFLGSRRGHLPLLDTDSKASLDLIEKTDQGNTQNENHNDHNRNHCHLAVFAMNE